MKIKLGMPEVLVLFSLVMYSQSYTFSLIAFLLGLTGRVMDYLMNYSVEMKKAESMNQSIDELGSAFKDMFGGKKD